MAVGLSGHPQRFGVRTAYGALELAMLALLALAAANLVWAIFRPIGPVGAWTPRDDIGVVGAPAFSALDSVFGFHASGGQMVVSTSGITLHGLRRDSATGRGSAILAGEGEPQQSYAVGEEIVPGIRLQAVNADHVVLSRGGAEEVIFFEEGARTGTRPAAAASRPATVRRPPRVGPGLNDAVSFTPPPAGQPGLVVGAGRNSALFLRTGLREGDILLTIDGQAVSQPAQVYRATRGMQPGTPIRVEIERGGNRLPLTVRVPGQ